VNQPAPTELSLVIPCYNEAEVLPVLKARLLQSLNSLGLSWEVIFVDDGSRDSTCEQLGLMHHDEPRFKVVSFSRNFGHQLAVYAGLAYATGRAVGMMVADLQDPPEIFAQCLNKLREGYDVVYAVRKKRKENAAKRAAYALFYRFLRFVAEVDIPLDSGDFCLMSQRVVKVLRRMPERNVFVRGLRAWAGFRQIGLEYERDPRAAGETKYPFKRLLRLTTDGVFAFSTLPLKLATYVGYGALCVSVLFGVVILAWRICGFRLMGHTASELPGWTAVAGGMLFIAGVQFLILGCMGEYIGRIYTEVKKRPRWIVRETLGMERRDEDLDPGDSP